MTTDSSKNDAPDASAPAVAGATAAQHDPNTLAPQQVLDLTDDDGEFNPFTDTAPPVGAALDAITDEVDYSIDFNHNDVPFTIVEGDVQVAVKTVNNRTVVEVSTLGWVGPGFVFGPYQLKFLAKATANASKKLPAKRR